MDGQNLFHGVCESFGYKYPNYDISALARAICARSGWALGKVCFYTGVPSARDDSFWNHFWTAKLAHMGREGVSTYSRPLRYRNQTVRVGSGASTIVRVAQEKGIDVRLALDIIALAHKRVYDVGIIFSQDQDLSEVADEIRLIVRSQGRWIKLVSAFPVGSAQTNTRGINGTDWVRIDRALYDACIDPRDYRPKSGPAGGSV